MKISKKLKWGLSLLGVGAVSIIPMGVVLSSCSSSDDSNNGDNSNNNQNNGGANNGFVVDENGIIQPLTKNDITPTKYNFDNRLTANTAEIKQISSLEEANQELMRTWNNLKEEEKLACIENDIQNWFNQSWYNSEFTSTWVWDNQSTPIPAELLEKNSGVWDSDSRSMAIATLNNVSLTNNNLNFTYNFSIVCQAKSLNSATVDAQFEYTYNYNYENITLTPIILQINNNQYVSGFKFSYNSNSNFIGTLDSITNYIINESIEGFTSSDIADWKNNIGGKIIENTSTDPELLNQYGCIISPYLNMIFEINNN